MKTQLTISLEPIDEAAMVATRSVSTGAGAVVYFAGLVRDSEASAQISALEYEAFLKMAEHQFELIFQEIARRWPIEAVRLIHRVGVVKVNQPSLWVEITAPHRGEALEACQWLIDEMKRTVPIWKKPVP